jgi:osmotically-inducible protein OsmY
MSPDLWLCESSEPTLDTGPAIDDRDITNEFKEVAGEGKIPSDIELTQSVQAAIRRSALASDTVRAVVRNGWLILDGEVEGPMQKRAAEDTVRGLTGIRGMSNNIQIICDTIARRVSQKIDETLTLGARLSAHRVSVMARDHTIILSGFVRTNQEREDAEAAAWAVPGVAEVINRIRTT